MRKFFLFLFLLLLLPLTLFAVYHGARLFGLAKKTSESKPLYPKDNITQPEYKNNEVIIKLENNKKLTVKKEIQTNEDIFNIKAVDFNSLDQEENPQILTTLNQKYKIRQIEKVFKGINNPQQELFKVKQKFSKEINQGKKQINEEEFLKIDLSNIYKISFSNKVDIQDVIAQISLSPDIGWAEPNYIFKTQLLTNDPYLLDPNPISIERNLPINQGGWNPLNNDGSFLDYQWNLKKINMPEAWEISLGSEGIKIGIVDTGVDYYHRELLEICLPGFDYVNNDNDPMDDFGHGTHVAGIINSLSNNGLGIAGISWQSRIIPIKVFDDKGSGALDKVSLGIVDVVNRGADVINMSFGMSYPTSTIPNTLAMALDYLYSNGIVAVAAAGNNNDDLGKGYWPANYESVISVSASDQTDSRASFSNYGNNLLISAPGGAGRELDSDNYSGRNIISLQSNNRGNPVDMNEGGTPVGQEKKYLRARGTSMAAPHVTGLVALILAKRSDLLGQPNLVRNIIANGAEDIEEIGFDIYSGYGRINALRSISELKTDPLPNVTISYPIKGLTINPKNGVEIKGTVEALGFERYDLSYYSFDNPSEQRIISSGTYPITDGILGLWKESITTGNYIVEVTIYYSGGKTRKYSVKVRVDGDLKAGWPVHLASNILEAPAVADLNKDGIQEIIAATKEGDIDIFNYDGSKFIAWPGKKFTGTQVAAIPAVGNLDNDPDLEFVITVFNREAGERKIYAFNYDGTLVSGNWPIDDDFILPSISLADLDNDGMDEIIGFIYYPAGVMVWRGDASKYPGYWPSPIDSTIYYSYPTIANLDNDSQKSLEIVVQSSQHLTILKNNGERTVSVKLDQNILDGARSPALGDIDGDGKKEIVIYETQSISGLTQDTISVFRNDGSRITGGKFPIVIGNSPNSINNRLSPAISNINDNLRLEILAGNKLYNYQGTELINFSVNSPFNINSISGDINNDGKKEFFGQSIIEDPDPPTVYGWDEKGNLLTNFPKPLLIKNFGGFNYVQVNTPILTDLENDSYADLVVTNNGYLLVFDVSERKTIGDLDWPQYLHDKKHTGSYELLQKTPVCIPCPRLFEPKIGGPWCTKKDRCGCLIWVLCDKISSSPTTFPPYVTP